MTNVIDFESARIRLRSNVKDPVIIQDMLDNAYDPCDPEDVNEYWMREELVNMLSESITFDFDQEYTIDPEYTVFITDK